ncbi:periaxin [Falco naumanni]|uniref:periaxin n=1 Tax=Falco naumanni TaxID=148594 RepID=UPI001ADE5453|nr:periaxin [Falco naumanni]
MTSPGGGNPPIPPMEEETELVELETAPEAGVRGITVARDRRGLYIAKAPRSLRTYQGDRLVSARIFFEGAPPEDVAQVLEGARSCKVSLCLQHRLPGTPSPLGGTRTSGEGHQGKVARLSIPILTPSKKPPLAPSTVSPAPASPVAVEFALPKLSKLVKSWIAAEPASTAASTPVLPAAEPKRPRATPSRLTVKEAAAGKTPVMELPPVKPEVSGTAVEVLAGPSTRLPAMEVAAPKVTVGLSLAGAMPPAAPQAKEPALRLPQLEVAVPALPLPAAILEPGTTITQPQISLGEEETPSNSRKGRGSPVLKTKLPSFGTATVEDKEGDAGTRGGFAGIRVPSITIAIPSAAVELVPELSVPKPELAIAGEQPRLEVKLPARRSESPPAAPARLTFLETAVPSIDIAVPRVGVGLALPAGASMAAAPAEGDATAMPDVAARFAKGLRKLSLELEPTAALPEVEIASPAQLTGDMLVTGIKPKAPKFTLPRFGLSLTKLKTSSDGDRHPLVAHDTAVPTPPSVAVTSPAVALDLALGMVGATGASAKLKVPKLSLAPFGVKDEGVGGEAHPQDAGAVMKLPRFGIGRSWGDDGRSAELGSPGTPQLRVPQVGIALPAPGSRRVPSLPKLPTGSELGRGLKLPKFGGSSPDIRTGGDSKIMRRGGSAESLSIGTAGRKMLESPGTIWLKLKTKGGMGDGGVQPVTPRFTIPTVGFTVPVKQPEHPASQKIPKPTSMPALKVPVLELAPPGMEEVEETARKDMTPGRWSRVKLPKFGAGFAGSGLEGEGRMRMGSVKKAMLVLVKPKEKGEDNQMVDTHRHINGEAEGKGRRWRWVPRVGFSPREPLTEPPVTQPKGGKMWLPNVELSSRDAKFNQ